MQETVAVILVTILCAFVITAPILIRFYQVSDEVIQDIKRLRKTADSAFKASTAKEIKVLKEVYKKDFTGAETVTLEGVYKKYISRNAHTSNVTEYIDQYEIRGVVYMTSALSFGDTFKVRGAFFKGRLYLLEVRKPSNGSPEGVGICDFIKTNRISIIDDIEKINNLKSQRNMRFNEKGIIDYIAFFSLLGTLPFALFGFAREPTVQVSILLLFFALSAGVIIFKFFQQTPVYQLTGKLIKSGWSTKIADIEFVIPHEWHKDIENNQTVQIEGRKNFSGRIRLDALKLNEHNMNKDRLAFSKKRAIFLIAFLFIYSIFSCSTWNDDNFKRYREYTSAKGMKLHFNSYNEIKTFDFKVGQRVNFNHLNYLHLNDVSTVYLLDKPLQRDQKIEREIVKLEDKARKLEQFFRSPHFFINQNQAKEYRQYEAFNRLIELLEKPNANNDKVYNALLRFLTDYIKEMNDKVKQIEARQLAKINKAIMIDSNDFKRNHDFYFSRLTAKKIKIPDLKKNFYGTEQALVSGVISKITTRGGTQKITLVEHKNYTDIKKYKNSFYLMYLYGIVLLLLIVMLLKEALKFKNAKIGAGL